MKMRCTILVRLLRYTDILNSDAVMDIIEELEEFDTAESLLLLLLDIAIGQTNTF